MRGRGDGRMRRTDAGTRGSQRSSRGRERTRGRRRNRRRDLPGRTCLQIKRDSQKEGEEGEKERRARDPGASAAQRVSASAGDDGALGSMPAERCAPHDLQTTRQDRILGIRLAGENEYLLVRIEASPAQNGAGGGNVS